MLVKFLEQSYHLTNKVSVTPYFYIMLRNKLLVTGPNLGRPDPPIGWGSAFGLFVC